MNVLYASSRTSRGGRRRDVEDLVERLGRGPVVGHGADAADLLRQRRHHLGRAAHAEPLEPAELRHHEEGRVHVAGVPFAPGTEVQITISPKVQSEQAATPQLPGALADALRWEGNVLVHQGIGAGALVAELREERLNRLGQGRSG